MKKEDIQELRYLPLRNEFLNLIQQNEKDESFKALYCFTEPHNKRYPCNPAIIKAHLREIGKEMIVADSVPVSLKLPIKLGCVFIINLIQFILELDENSLDACQ